MTEKSKHDTFARGSNTAVLTFVDIIDLVLVQFVFNRGICLAFST